MPPAAGGHRPRLLLLVALLALLAGSTSLTNDFAYDDNVIVQENPLVTDPGRIGEIFRTPYWGTRAGGGLYRPMAILSYALDHRLHGGAPFGYHLVNVLAHLLVSLLVTLVALEALPRGPAALAGMFFAVHPIHTEAVANVVGRAEILAALGSLAAWWLYQRRDGPAWPRRLLAAAALAFGLFSKEVAIALPPLLLFWDLVRRRRPDWSALALQFAVVGIYLAFRIEVLGALGNPKELVLYRVNNVIGSQPWLPGLWTALGVFGRYAVLLVCPWRLSADYSYPMITGAGPFEPWSWMGLLVLAGSIVLFVRALRAMAAGPEGRPDDGVARATALGLTLFGGTFFLVSNFTIRIGTVMAERLLYLPSAGVCLLLAAAGWRLWLRSGAGGRRRLAGLAALLIVAGAGRSMARNLDWKDGRTLAVATLKTSPRSARAQFNMAPRLGEQRRWEEALTYVRRAIELDSTYTEAWTNQGGYLIKLGRYNEAREALKGSLRLEPEGKVALLALGALEIEAGRPRDAIPPLEKASQVDSTTSEIFYDLALARAAAGDTAGAIADYRAAARLKPGDADTHNNLAWLLCLSGGPALPEAIEEAHRAIALRSDGSNWDTLAEALYRSGRPGEARAAWEKALALGAPNSPQIRMRLAGLREPAAPR